MTVPTTTPPRLQQPAATESLDHAAEKRVVEALIFVSSEPVTIEQIGQVLTSRRPEDLRAIVDELDSDLADSGRALRIEEVAGGFRLCTRPDLAPWIRIHFRNRNRSRLSTAAIETLAVVAYKQPITGPEVQEIRGVDPQGALRTLLERRLIRIAGRKKVVGRPFLYGTTPQFLMHFGLASINDLPPIEEFERLAGESPSEIASEPGEAGGESGRVELQDIEDTERSYLERSADETGEEE